MIADAIILGLGAMGSAAASQLAQRGLSVLGFDQFSLGHSRGSSHGQTRIIRTAYYEHPSYVPLVRRSFELWKELETAAGQQLLTHSPCLNIGPPNGEVVRGVLAAARQHKLLTETLSAAELGLRFPAFHLPDPLIGVLESEAGYLAVEECVRAFQETALSTGRVHFRPDEAVLSWNVVGTGVEVHTALGTYSAAKLIITAGAWTRRVLAEIGLPLTVMRQTMHWFDGGSQPARFRPEHFPIFLLEAPGGACYGLPAVDALGFKCARHYGAEEVESPHEIDWLPSPNDVAALRPFLDQYLPGAGACTRCQVCLYTLTPDRHFAIDRHPHFSQVIVAAGFSGHGFKFAPVVGEILADLATAGRTKHDIGLFGLSRFSTMPMG